MAENIEFIAANDLPEAEGDEVSVLCLEGGELKQKPGASLGGKMFWFPSNILCTDYKGTGYSGYPVYKDDTMTELITYSEAKELVKAGKFGTYQTGNIGASSKGEYTAYTVLSDDLRMFDTQRRMLVWKRNHSLFFADTDVDAL